MSVLAPVLRRLQDILGKWRAFAPFCTMPVESPIARLRERTPQEYVSATIDLQLARRPAARLRLRTTRRARADARFGVSDTMFGLGPVLRHLQELLGQRRAFAPFRTIVLGDPIARLRVRIPQEYISAAMDFRPAARLELRLRTCGRRAGTDAGQLNSLACVRAVAIGPLALTAFRAVALNKQPSPAVADDKPLVHTPLDGPRIRPTS